MHLAISFVSLFSQTFRLIKKPRDKQSRQLEAEAEADDSDCLNVARFWCFITKIFAFSVFLVCFKFVYISLIFGKIDRKITQLLKHVFKKFVKLKVSNA